LQEQNNFKYIATINIKIIKGNRAIISYTPKNLSTLLRKSFSCFGLLNTRSRSFLYTNQSRRIASDEGMTNGPSTFAYLAFRPRGDTVERITKPMKRTAWLGPGM
jgi:hypothetical protein